MTVTTISGRSQVDVIPVGVIIPWAHSSNAPQGWLMCDGSAVSISTYGELYGVITKNGTAFPFGANVGSTFVLPSLNSTGYMPRSPSTTTPPSGANSNVGATVAATTHSHTWDIGAAVTGADGISDTHYHNRGTTFANAISAAHNTSANLVANTVNATGTNMSSNGSTSTAFRAHGHNFNSQAATQTHTAHSHSTLTGANLYLGSTHSHTWTTSGTSSTPTAINAYVDHLLTRYIIFAKPAFSGMVV